MLGGGSPNGGPVHRILVMVAGETHHHYRRPATEDTKLVLETQHGNEETRQENKQQKPKAICMHAARQSKRWACPASCSTPKQQNETERNRSSRRREEKTREEKTTRNPHETRRRRSFPQLAGRLQQRNRRRMLAARPESAPRAPNPGRGTQNVQATTSFSQRSFAHRPLRGRSRQTRPAGRPRRSGRGCCPRRGAPTAPRRRPPWPPRRDTTGFLSPRVWRKKWKKKMGRIEIKLILKKKKNDKKMIKR